MTEFTKLADDFYISGQITLDHICQASADGFKYIINLRPDGEKPGYVTAATAAGTAKNNNVTYHHMPIAMTGPLPEQVAEFKVLMEKCDGSVLVHCGSGKRAAILWALSNKGNMTADEILSSCAECGHDLAMLRPHL